MLHKKHLGFTALRHTAANAARLALRGQTNFLRMLWRFAHVYNAGRQYADHARPVTYAMRAGVSTSRRDSRVALGVILGEDRRIGEPASEQVPQRVAQHRPQLLGRHRG